jgi:hypothetical protein
VGRYFHHDRPRTPEVATERAQRSGRDLRARGISARFFVELERSERSEAGEFEFVTGSQGATSARAAMRPKFLYSRRPRSALFSGWNCVASTLSRATMAAKSIP